MALKLQHTETTAAQGCLKCSKSGKSRGGGGRGGAPTRNTFPPGTLPLTHQPSAPPAILLLLSLQRRCFFFIKAKSSVCLSFWENPENYHFLPKPQKQTDAGTERGWGATDVHAHSPPPPPLLHPRPPHRGGRFLITAADANKKSSGGLLWR